MDPAWRDFVEYLQPRMPTSLSGRRLKEAEQPGRSGRLYMIFHETAQDQIAVFAETRRRPYLGVEWFVRVEPVPADGTIGPRRAAFMVLAPSHLEARRVAGADVLWLFDGNEQPTATSTACRARLRRFDLDWRDRSAWDAHAEYLARACTAAATPRQWGAPQLPLRQEAFAAG